MTPEARTARDTYHDACDMADAAYRTAEILRRRAMSAEATYRNARLAVDAAEAIYNAVR